MQRRLFLLAICLGVLPVLFHSVTVAAATCSGSSCDGKSPSKTGCSADASVVANSAVLDSYGYDLGTVSFYWSPTCRAGYTYVQTNGAVAPVVSAQQFIDSTHTNYAFANNATSVTSPLLSASSASQIVACGTIRLGQPNSDGYLNGEACVQ